MSITSYTDIVIAICILVSVLVGYHRGFLVTIARIVAMVASYIGAILAAEMLKKTLAQTLFVPMIRQGLGNGAFADLAQEALLQTAEGIAYSVVFFVVFALLQFVLLRAIRKSPSSMTFRSRCSPGRWSRSSVPPERERRRSSIF